MAEAAFRVSLAERPVRGWVSRRSDPDGSTAQPSKLAAQVARQIEGEIIARDWPVGSVLGSESELMSRYDVSRGVLREAVRIVEHHDVAMMRRGPSGGLIVRAPDVSAATTAMVIYFDYVGTSVEDLLTARSAVEPLAAALAARRITENGIARLRAAVEAEQILSGLSGALPNSLAGDLVHRTIAEVSENPALELFVGVLSQLTQQYAQPLRRAAKAVLEEVVQASDLAHRRIVEAIIAGDADLARYQMAIHVEAMGQWLRPRRGSHSVPVSAEGKLGEQVARRIRAQIVSAGWPVGRMVGSEPDLLLQHDVSRAVLREGVRLLEHHGVARMRRGRGGGLVVTAPDPTASIEAIALFLNYRRTGVEALRVVRDAVELVCIDRVAGRVGEPAVADRLTASLVVDAETPLEQLAECGYELHVAIGELSGSRVLPVFLRIVMSLWARYPQDPSVPVLVPPAEAPTILAQLHRKVVEALLVGDPGLAKHRLRRHLEEATAWWH